MTITINAVFIVAVWIEQCIYTLSSWLYQAAKTMNLYKKTFHTEKVWKFNSITEIRQYKKDLSDVKSSLVGVEADHKLTAESVPALCKIFGLVARIIFWPENAKGRLKGMKTTHAVKWLPMKARAEHTRKFISAWKWEGPSDKWDPSLGLYSCLFRKISAYTL